MSAKTLGNGSELNVTIPRVELERLQACERTLAALAQLPPGWSLTHDEYLNEFELGGPVRPDGTSEFYTGTFEEMMDKLAEIVGDTDE